MNSGLICHSQLLRIIRFGIAAHTVVIDEKGSLRLQKRRDGCVVISRDLLSIKRILDNFAKFLLRSVFRRWLSQFLFRMARSLRLFQKGLSVKSLRAGKVV